MSTEEAMNPKTFSSQACVLLLAAGLVSSLVACGDEGGQDEQPAGNGELSVVAPGKADNYYSNVAREYEFVGSIVVELTEEEANSPDVFESNAKIAERLSAIGLYLTTYLTDKFRGIDSNGDGEISDDEVFFHNEEYGGFHAMVRNYSFETSGVGTNGDEPGYIVTFTVDVAGPKGLLDLIPGEKTDYGTLLFDLQMPAGATVPQGDDVPRRDIRRFDPNDYDGDLEKVSFEAHEHIEITNAYPHYAEFMQDGVYDITLFNGHDYNEARYDLQEAEEFFHELQYLGFKAPADTFEDLNADSGPFTKTIKANGKDVLVEVRVYHSDMFANDRQRQHDLALSETATRDVFFYNGHAGPYYGFYLDAAGAAKVDYTEFAEYPMSDKQQLMFAQGCQTYSQYADILYANPKKSESNLDVITTVNYSYGRGTMSVVRNLLQTDYDDNHVPVDWFEIIADLNSDWVNSSRDVLYGVMGIWGNPQIHPYVSEDTLGKECVTDADCGDPAAHVCADPGDGVRQCAGVTLSQWACPSNTDFRHLASGSVIVEGACFLRELGDEVFGVRENSDLALEILELFTWADEYTLDEEVGLDSRAAKNIIDHQLGPDGEFFTADDNPIDSLEELDSISYVGERAFGKLVAYVGTQQ